MSATTLETINKYAHGIRGYVQMNGITVGVAQDVTFDDIGDQDAAYVMGSRSPQNVEIINKLVQGRVKTLILDAASLMIDKARPQRLTAGGVLEQATVVMDTSSGKDISKMIGILPEFDIVLYNIMGMTASGTSSTQTQLKVTIKNAKIKGKSYDFSKDKYWITGVEFIATNVEEEITDVTL